MNTVKSRIQTAAKNTIDSIEADRAVAIKKAIEKNKPVRIERINATSDKKIAFINDILNNLENRNPSEDFELTADRAEENFMMYAGAIKNSVECM